MIHQGPKRNESGQLTVAEAGRRGGLATKASQPDGHFKAIAAKGGKECAKRGREYYQAIGRKGGLALREARGHEHYRSIGAKGGHTTLAAHGREHFGKLGRQGAARVKQLLEKAKRLEAME